ncbi:F-box protein At5g03970 [Phalaenopsis equestris]|uniref:F-box protein At5g03970 n=1 Tax=Phalaenopsis equestris TaxID=78828 RepID=UPI0009E63BF9|nr:F-box protein At5g03970 [Phalaenopsis equestris]
MDLQKKQRGDFDEEEAVVAGDISVIGEDLLHEILLRLPPSSLLSSISVSRYWLRLCSSPLFRHHYRSRRASSFGFFVNYPCEGPVFIPFSSSSTAVSDLGSVQILDSRGGWLLLLDLVTSCLRVFHPIFNKTLSIVQPSLDNATSVFHALLPDPFSFNPLCRFRILRVSTKLSSCPIIEIFSSESPGEWKKIQYLYNIRTRRCLGDQYPVLVNGFIHWLKGDRQILALDEKNYDLSILGLPRTLPLYITNRWLGKFNDQLCYAYVEESVLYVWVLVDRLHCEWHLAHRIELGRFREFCHFNQIRFLGFGIGGSLNAIFQGLMGNIFSLDLGSGELREIGKTGFDIDHVFPYNSVEADWSISLIPDSEALL